MINTEVLEPVATEDSACLDSNSSIPVVHIKSDPLETDGLELLVGGGTYVDTILTALPVSFFQMHISPFLGIFSSVKLYVSANLDCWLSLSIWIM